MRKWRAESHNKEIEAAIGNIPVARDIIFNMVVICPKQNILQRLRSCILGRQRRPIHLQILQIKRYYQRFILRFIFNSVSTVRSALGGPSKIPVRLKVSPCQDPITPLLQTHPPVCWPRHLLVWLPAGHRLRYRSLDQIWPTGKWRSSEW